MRAADFTGRVFGRLAVLARAGSIGGRTNWLCRCACGQEVTVLSSSLRAGKTRSCGCLRADVARAAAPLARAARALRRSAA